MTGLKEETISERSEQYKLFMRGVKNSVTSIQSKAHANKSNFQSGWAGGYAVEVFGGEGPGGGDRFLVTSPDYKTEQEFTDIEQAAAYISAANGLVTHPDGRVLYLPQQ